MKKAIALDGLSGWEPEQLGKLRPCWLLATAYIAGP